MKIWVDDVRAKPGKISDGWVACNSVNCTIYLIEKYEESGIPIDVIDLDHDAGKYAYDGGDYIRILDWLEKTGRNYPIHIHSMNPVGIENMRRIIEKNGWKEV